MIDNPEPPTAGVTSPGLVYTFYSFKGGVGRSMAVANVGVALALQGLRVLLIDWDLEAPGLEYYFPEAMRKGRDLATTPGVLDLLESRCGSDSLNWKECLTPIAFSGVSLDLMTAGRRSEDYRRRVQHLDWRALYAEHDVGNFVEQLRQEWRQAYDFVLVDSRTGISDNGDVCTVLLPDVLVLVFVTNQQNIDGVLSTLERARRLHAKLPLERSTLIALPLLSRDERKSEYRHSVDWQRRVASAFEETCEEWLPKDSTADDLFSLLYLPYVPEWSFGERLPWLEEERERTDPGGLGMAYTRVAALLASRLDWSTLVERVTNESELASARQQLHAVREALRETEEQAELERDRARREADEAQRIRQEAIAASLAEEAAKARATDDLNRAQARVRRWRYALLLVVFSLLIGVAAAIAVRVWTERGSAPSQGIADPNSTDPVQRRQALRAIDATGRDPRLTSAIVLPLLRDADAAVRLEAIRAWSRIGLKPSDAITEFTDLLRDTDLLTRREAVTLVGFQGSQARVFLDTLEALLEHPEAATRAIAATAIGNVGPEATSVGGSLARLFNDPDASVRRSAVEAVARLERNGADFFGLISDMQRDPDASVRVAAIDAMAKMGPLPQLAAFLRDTDPAVRGRAAVEIAAAGAEGRRYVRQIAALMSDPEPDVRVKALDALSRMAESAGPYRPSITSLLNDRDWRVRAQAIAALAELQPLSAASLIAIERASVDPHPAVRREAARVLVLKRRSPASAPAAR
jgi:HEAT repeat protein/MinD-like ATPase involved in chromosome partitioning or flagellar assembly